MFRDNLNRFVNVNNDLIESMKTVLLVKRRQTKGQ